MPLSSVLGAQSITKPGVCTSTTRPSSPFDGQVIYETDTDRTLVWNNSAWVAVSYAVYTSSARPSSPYTGQLIYETDTNRVSAYNGSSWVYTHSSGMVRVASQSFSSSTAVNVNNCFTSTYTNYTLRIGATGSNGAASFIRLRASGSDDTGSNYRRQRFYINSGTFGANDSGATTSLNLHFEASTRTYSTIDVLGPALANHTTFFGQSQINGTEVLFTGGLHNQSTSFDGFSLIFTNGNSGFVDVYGWAQ